MLRANAVGVVLTVALVFGGLGCREAEEGAAPKTAEGTLRAARAVAPASSAEAGAGARPAEGLMGVVRFEGRPPARHPIDMSADPVCARHQMLSRNVIVTDGRLANVLVYLPDAGLPKRPVPGTLEIDQKDCLFEPRVSCTEVGRTVAFANDDPTMHNVHVYEGTDRARTILNRAQLPDAKPFHEIFDEGGSYVHLTCDVHPWMNGWIYVSRNGWCTVTGEDGRFSLPGLPPGRYEVKTWHEVYGRKSWNVVVEEGRAAKLTVTYGPSDARE